MSLIYNGVTIPNGAVITYGGTTLTKIIFDGVTVWQKATPTSWQEKTYNRSTSSTATYSSTHDFGSAKELVSVYMKCTHHVDAPTVRYRVFGSNNNSTWTKIAEWSTNGGSTTLDLSGTYRYVKLEQYKANWFNSSYADPWVYSCEPWRINYYN